MMLAFVAPFALSACSTFLPQSPTPTPTATITPTLTPIPSHTPKPTETPHPIATGMVNLERLCLPADQVDQPQKGGSSPSWSRAKANGVRRCPDCPNGG